MDNNKNENGAEVADKISEQNTVRLKMTANGSYEQSLLIAAISKSLGFEGLISPVTNVHEGTEYTFDFYHQGSKRLLKEITSFEDGSYDEYLMHPAEPVLIIDSDLISCQQKCCECGHLNKLLVDDLLAEHLCEDPLTFSYHKGWLWEFESEQDDVWVWKRRMPGPLRGFLESSDEECVSEQENEK